MAVFIGDATLVGRDGQGMSHDITNVCLRVQMSLPQARLQYLDSGHPTLQESTEVPEEFDDPSHHQALAFEYYTDAYGFFLEGADVFEEQDQILENRYGTPFSSEGWYLIRLLYSENERACHCGLGRTKGETPPSKCRI